jgi:hypothetical protein
MASRPSRSFPTPPSPVNPFSSTDHDHIYPAYPYRDPHPFPVPSFAHLDRAFPSTRDGQLLHYVEELYYTRAFTIY